MRIADQFGHADPAMTARVYLGRDFEGDKADLAIHLQPEPARSVTTLVPGRRVMSQDIVDNGPTEA